MFKKISEGTQAVFLQKETNVFFWIAKEAKHFRRLHLAVSVRRNIAVAAEHPKGWSKILNI